CQFDQRHHASMITNALPFGPASPARHILVRGRRSIRMKSRLTRRQAIQAAGLGAAAMAAPVARPENVPTGMRGEGPDTPKICLEMGGGALAAGGFDEAGMKRVKQLG